MKGKLSVCFASLVWVLKALVRITKSKQKKHLKCVQPAFTQDVVAFEAKRTPPRDQQRPLGRGQAWRPAPLRTMGATS